MITRCYLFRCVCMLFVVVLTASGCSDNKERLPSPSPKQISNNKKIKKVNKDKKLGKVRTRALPRFDSTKPSFDNASVKLIEFLAQDAINRDDLKTLSKFAITARNSKDPAIRLAVVNALSWFQGDALADLLLFMNDEDLEVATSALRYTDLFFDSVKRESVRIKLIRASLAYATDDMVDSVVSKFDNINKLQAVQNIVQLLNEYDDDSVVKNALLREYNFVTGEDYVSAEVANKWIINEYRTSD